MHRQGPANLNIRNDPQRCMYLPLAATLHPARGVPIARETSYAHEAINLATTDSSSRKNTFIRAAPRRASKWYYVHHRIGPGYFGGYSTVEASSARTTTSRSSATLFPVQQ
ncbi:MAG: hypothetical protein JOZ19_05940 [Rubrobacter sp.]|nr:hypothetical protein [Rubrobacter sp.]